MKLFAAALVLFLLAFTGLAIGLIVRKRGLRSGCGHAPRSEQDCRCESELDANMRGQSDQQCKKGDSDKSLSSRIPTAPVTHEAIKKIE